MDNLNGQSGVYSYRLKRLEWLEVPYKFSSLDEWLKWESVPMGRRITLFQVLQGARAKDSNTMWDARLCLDYLRRQPSDNLGLIRALDEWIRAHVHMREFARAAISCGLFD